ncbi:spexin prohormone 1 [Ictalurus punctatus]|uniref:Spexin prohormone 1 n=1 Tax=Ictalurus punctatus TaxID=7998 RepID=A0A9F7TSR5_ICTPU|nr:spexin prohormone 1 [Ictalurus furcatus]XP_053505741.1 spexin prohormone 1 [Ictalurus furcatus]XP_053505742.1 spexin prohormone 1 [Ictalurus furcatus]XP_053505743.1 spexin prohormone 1 [Ictalurus furcatus]XP_053544159.1 spexin prohormone 1 [Ictalurus punctatus]
MKSVKMFAAYALVFLLLSSLVSQACSAPKGRFQRRNWTPQAMLYLKGTQGRRFVSVDRNEGDVFDTLHLETQNENTENLSVSKAATVLLNFLQQAKDEGMDNGLFLQDAPVWKRDYF